MQRMRAMDLPPDMSFPCSDSVYKLLLVMLEDGIAVESVAVGTEATF